MKEKETERGYKCQSLFKFTDRDSEVIAQSFLKQWCEYITLQENKKKVAV